MLGTANDHPGDQSANHFPISANQDEPYHYAFVLNNNQPITVKGCCGGYDSACSDAWLEIKQWGGYTVNADSEIFPWGNPPGQSAESQNMPPCPSGLDRYQLTCPYSATWPDDPFKSPNEPDGTYRSYAVVRRWFFLPDGTQSHDQVAYTVFDFTIKLN